MPEMVIHVSLGDVVLTDCFDLGLDVFIALFQLFELSFETIDLFEFLRLHGDRRNVLGWLIHLLGLGSSLHC